MKRLVCLLVTLTVCLMMTNCSKMDNQPKDIKPQESQMKSICELATMKCYYHNVAKYTEEDASGILFWMKDRKFWVEYAGVVTIGIDTSKVKIEVQNDNVTITLPQAQVLGCEVDETTLTEDSFIVAKDSAKVEAEHQTAAIKEAQAKMKQSASANTALLANAQQRAQKLLEDYVNNIGDCVGRKYQITWLYLEDNMQIEGMEENQNE